jgi:hypothetical protein
MKQAYNHRPQDFKRRILKTNITSREATYIEEQRWLNMIKLTEIKPTNPTPRYYNLCITNNEMWHKYEERIVTVGQKISAAKKGKPTGPCSPETAKKISEAKKAAFASGKTIYTEEWRRKNSEGKLGKPSTFKGKHHSTESKEKLRQTQLGRKHSAETIAKRVASCMKARRNA